MSEQEAENDDIPSASDVLADVSMQTRVDPDMPSAYEAVYLNDFRLSSIKSEMEFAHLQGIRDHYAHKGRWSWFLMATVGIMLIFQSALLLCVGNGNLDFTKYEWLLPALMVQNLGQVIGLAVYAVKYLFSDISNQK